MVEKRRFELLTRCLQNSRSTPELLPHYWNRTWGSHPPDRGHNPACALAPSGVNSSRKAGANPTRPVPRPRTLRPPHLTGRRRPNARRSDLGANDRIRTYPPFRAQPSQDCASTSSATLAYLGPPRRTRTCPPFRAPVFEAGASTSSASRGCGACERIRTSPPFRAPDSESGASTSSATQA